MEGRAGRAETFISDLHFPKQEGEVSHLMFHLITAETLKRPLETPFSRAHHGTSNFVLFILDVNTNLHSEPDTPRSQSAPSTSARTLLTFHTSTQHTLKTTVTAIHPFSALEEANRALFKQATEEDHVVITEATIFHPQGGGQPSDEGVMTSSDAEATNAEVSQFTVSSARMDAIHDGRVLHLGRFAHPHSLFTPGTSVTQTLDSAKRLLYSRLHTAGHVLGAAVRHLLEPSVPGFDELKASHFPDSAACEFAGLIDGKHKAAIQEKVDAYVEKDMEVVVEFWDWEEFEKRGVHAPDRSLAPPGGKFRVVRIRDCEVYPCGGTHVASTRECGRTTVKKISRSKGTSRVSYTVEA